MFCDKKIGELVVKQYRNVMICVALQGDIGLPGFKGGRGDTGVNGIPVCCWSTLYDTNDPVLTQQHSFFAANVSYYANIK